MPGASAGSKGYDDADVSDAEQVLLQLGAAQQSQPVHNDGHHGGDEEKGGGPSVREIHLPDDTAHAHSQCCGSGSAWIRIIFGNLDFSDRIRINLQMTLMRSRIRIRISI